MPLTPRIIAVETGTELWLAAQCATHCNISPSTWRQYVTKHAPQPKAHLDKRTPLWDAKEVQAWHATRRGSGNWKNT